MIGCLSTSDVPANRVGHAKPLRVSFANSPGAAVQLQNQQALTRRGLAERHKGTSEVLRQMNERNQGLLSQLGQEFVDITRAVEAVSSPLILSPCPS